MQVSQTRRNSRTRSASRPARPTAGSVSMSAAARAGDVGLGRGRHQAGRAQLAQDLGEPLVEPRVEVAGGVERRPGRGEHAVVVERRVGLGRPQPARAASRAVVMTSATSAWTCWNCSMPIASVSSDDQAEDVLGLRGGAGDHLVGHVGDGRGLGVEAVAQLGVAEERSSARRARARRRTRPPRRISSNREPSGWSSARGRSRAARGRCTAGRGRQFGIANANEYGLSSGLPLAARSTGTRAVRRRTGRWWRACARRGSRCRCRPRGRRAPSSARPSACWLRADRAVGLRRDQGVGAEQVLLADLLVVAPDVLGEPRDRPERTSPARTPAPSGRCSGSRRSGRACRASGRPTAWTPGGAGRGPPACAG